MVRSCDPLKIFEAPIISLERLNLIVKFCIQVSYINSSNRMTYHPQNGRGYGHVTVLKFFRLQRCSNSSMSRGFVSDRWTTCWDVARYWSKIADLNLPHLYLAPVGGDPLEFCPDLWHQKTSPYAIIWHCLREPAFHHFGTILACDRQTDGQTHNDSTYHPNIASHGKNTKLHTVNMAKWHLPIRWSSRCLHCIIQ